jgi:hypothetical protein
MSYSAWLADMLIEAHKTIRALRAEVQRLRCCGNCVNYYHSDEELCEGCKEPELKKWKEKD